MSARWVEAVAVMETRHVPVFEAALERAVSGLDATYRCEDVLAVQPDTEADEVWFHMALLNDRTIDDIRRVGEGTYLVPLRLVEEVLGFVRQGLFSAAAGAVTVARVELRHTGLLRSLRRALRGEARAFQGAPLDLVAV